MTEMPLAPAPGITFAQSYYASGKDIAYLSQGIALRIGQARWDNGYNVEFVANYPQKIAGWTQATTTVLTDIPRAVLGWRDNAGAARTAIGTETHLYYMMNGSVTDITPLRTLVTNTLSSPVSTTINSADVTIADSTAEVAVGDWVFLQATTAVDGVLLNGWYPVASVTPGTSYVIIFPSLATNTGGPGGGTTTYQYPRVTLTNPFTTTMSSKSVEVMHASNGVAAGDYVDFSGATAVGGLTINGEYQIVSVIDGNHYTITASSAATSGASGGGSVSVIYPIPTQQGEVASIVYGGGEYGAGDYSSMGASVASTANGWTLAAYGDQLLACPIGGTIYIYDPVNGGRAYPMMNAPTNMNAMFVTPERFVVAVGVANQMQIAWCDQNDYTQWTTTAINTAETGRTIVGGSYLVGGIAVKPATSLIFSDRCVFVMTYTGSQFIYTTQQAGDNCGLAGPNAMCVEGGVAYWMSDYDFWGWNGTASTLPSDDIRAYVFGPGNLNRTELSKCIAMLNRQKHQVRFYYPASSMSENNVGMIYHYDQSCWSPLNFGRAAGTDANLLAYPVSCDQTGIVYYDEFGVDANGEPLGYLLQMGLMDVSNGDRNVDIMGFIPDFIVVSGTPEMYVLASFYPDQPPTVIGPYPMDIIYRQDLRCDGKLFGFYLTDDELGSNFRLGLPRFDVQPSGARR